MVANYMKALNPLRPSTLLQEVIEVIVSMWRELFISAGALVPILTKIIEHP